MALSDENLEASVSDAVPLSAEIEGSTSPTSVVAGNDVADESTPRPDDLMWSTQELRAAHQADSDIKVNAAWLSETTEKPPWEQVAIYSSTTKALWHQWSRLCLREGVLYRTLWSADGLSTSLQLVVPYHWSSSPFFNRSRLFAYGDVPFRDITETLPHRYLSLVQLLHNTLVYFYTQEL